MDTSFTTSPSETRRRFGLGLVALSLVISGCASNGAPDGSERLGEGRQALTSCVTLPAAADAMISNPPKNQNYGSHPLLRVGGKDESLLRFDLSSIPAGAVINSGTLKLYVNGGAGQNPIYVHASKTSWVEGSVTYSSYDQQYENAIAGTLLPSSPNALKSVSITSLVADWFSGAKANNGVLLETAGNQKTNFVSRDNNGGTVPGLEVCYTTPPVDHCASNPCANGGSCTNGDSTYTCACTAGWTGTNCDVQIDDCLANPCVNGACTDGQNTYTCACAPGWTAPNCDIEIDECASSPCEHGNCTDLVNGYVCECDAGFSGTNCETNINDCAGNPCQHAGVCTDGANHYTCACAPGWTGPNCDIDIQECASSPCEHGDCIEGQNSYTCACVPGFGGTNCETNIDECAPQNPCLNNGVCTDGIFDYDCACPAGFSGANCEIDIDECLSNPCQNGQCVDEVNDYQCVCTPGWTGADCNVDIDECLSSPCAHGDCNNLTNSYTCDCAPGWGGTNCDEPTAPSCPCAASPMWNDAFTYLNANPTGNVKDAYVPGYLYFANDRNFVTSNYFAAVQIFNNFDGTGTCAVTTLATADQTLPHNVWFEETLNETEVFACLEAAQQALPSDICGFVDSNGQCGNGQCIPDNDPDILYTCDCAPGWTGADCNIEIDECLSSPCVNGQCIDLVNQYECVCTPGWTGADCNIEIDECLSSPCVHGECIDLVNQYECVCTPGWTGADCNTAI